jgi:hypothetical protein
MPMHDVVVPMELEKDPKPFKNIFKKLKHGL